MENENLNIKLTSKEKESVSNQLAALFLFRDSLNYWKQNLTLFQVESICKKDDPLYPQLMVLWKKWEDNCTGKKWDVNEWYQVMLENILSPLLKLNCCFEAVRDTVRVYINAEKKLYHSIGKLDSEGVGPLVRQDWDRLADSTIAAFLLEWLITQPEMRQNIYQFAMKPFDSQLPLSELPHENTLTGESGFRIRYNALRDAYRDIEKMHNMRKLQIAKEGTEKTYFPQYSDAGYQIPYTTLCAMEFIANSKLNGRTETGLFDEAKGSEKSCLRIFKYISQRQDVFRNPSDRGKNNKIAAACADYAAVLDIISEWGKEAHSGDTTMAKKYVIASMMVMELEESHRLFLASAAAATPRRSKKNKDDVFVDEFESEIAYELLGRIPVIKYEPTCSNDPLDTDNVICISVGSVSAFNFLRYHEIVKYIYSTPLKTTMLYSLKVCLLRNIQANLLELLLMLFSTEVRLAWTEGDFQIAADFLYEKFNVVDAFRKIPFPELELHSGNKNGKRKRRKKDHYDRMREFFIMMQSWENQNKDQPVKGNQST